MSREGRLELGRVWRPLPSPSLGPSLLGGAQDLTLGPGAGHLAQEQCFTCVALLGGQRPASVAFAPAPAVSTAAPPSQALHTARTRVRLAGAGAVPAVADLLQFVPSALSPFLWEFSQERTSAVTGERRPDLWALLGALMADDGPAGT